VSSIGIGLIGSDELAEARHELHNVHVFVDVLFIGIGLRSLQDPHMNFRKCTSLVDVSSIGRASRGRRTCGIFT
jgi:hypothetical protein